MSTVIFSDAFRQKHVALAARLEGVRSSLFFDSPITLRDVSEGKGSEGRGLLVARASELLLCADGAGGAYVYDNPNTEIALAGLLARLVAMSKSCPVAADPHSLSVLSLADRLAQTEVPALLTGPTGAGKEVVSQFIHARSPRKDKSFVAVNCAAIPETMLEAMLFGHQKGSFTGASSGGAGLFREADGGTLLLDEIAEMPIGLQAKLLRALQEGEVLPVGATKPIKVDVRIIAAANRDLPTEVAEGRFREDLFYRLNVFPIHLASLRERAGDIAPLACTLLLRHRDKANGPQRISPAAIEMLTMHNWPGNVRELENVIRRALVLADNTKELGAEHIVFDAPARLRQSQAAPVASAIPMAIAANTPAEVPAAPSGPSGEPKLSNIVKLSEARAIFDTLKDCGGKRIEAAKRLGISERTLRYRLASYREAGMDMASAS